MAQGGRACALFPAGGTCEMIPNSPSSRQGLVGDDVLTASSEWAGLKDNGGEVGAVELCWGGKHPGLDLNRCWLPADQPSTNHGFTAFILGSGD